MSSYWYTLEPDDDALAHQAQLEERRFKEEWEREFSQWLDSLPPWYLQLDSDVDWIQENE